MEFERHVIDKIQIVRIADNGRHVGHHTRIGSRTQKKICAPLSDAKPAKMFHKRIATMLQILNNCPTVRGADFGNMSHRIWILM